MKAVFDTKPNSNYDDEIAHKYHFPQRYLPIAEKCVGDWVVFRRPRAAGEGISYFSVGRVIKIVADKTSSGHSYALIDNFLLFDNPVTWRENGIYAEAALRRIENVPQVGLFLRGKSIRKLEDDDFDALIEIGFSESIRYIELQSDGEFQRQTAEILVSRKIRDASFRRSVCLAYENRCAFTGLRMFDSQIHAEVQAAHIVAVQKMDPTLSKMVSRSRQRSIGYLIDTYFR